MDVSFWLVTFQNPKVKVSCQPNRSISDLFITVWNTDIIDLSSNNHKEVSSVVKNNLPKEELLSCIYGQPSF